VIYLHSEQ